jgi:hypothetical protein
VFAYGRRPENALIYVNYSSVPGSPSDERAMMMLAAFVGSWSAGAVCEPWCRVVASNEHAALKGGDRHFYA